MPRKSEFARPTSVSRVGDYFMSTSGGEVSIWTKNSPFNGGSETTQYRMNPDGTAREITIL
jgi:hypothetical protein